VVSCGVRTRPQLPLDYWKERRMAAKKQQTHAKRARELAVKERRERKRAKKAERAIAAQDAAVNGADSGASPEMPEDGSAAGMAPVEAR
jgi:hypothetical protein